MINDHRTDDLSPFGSIRVTRKVSIGLSVMALSCSLGSSAQEATDPLKANSDKAQQVFDQTQVSDTSKQANTEEMPVYPGGEKALYAILKKEIRYPKAAREEGITGRVYVEFDLEKNGNVDSAWVKRSIHPLLDEEAIRVVELLDGWSPGKMNGKPVKVRYTLPINFTMDPKELEKIRKKQAKRAAKAK